MNKELITVSICVYNADNYLPKAIDSICNQDYQNLDILLIDDGSTDNTGKICDEYAQKDSRIRVIHQANGGLCVARNTAITNMRGNYLMFVDSDDWVEPNIVSYLYEKVVENNLDMAACTSVDYFEDTNEVKKVQRGSDRIMSGFEALKDFYSIKSYTFDAIQCKLYRKDVIKEVIFTPGRSVDDTLTTPKILSNCERVGYFDIGLYNYLVRSNSMCRTTYNSKTIHKVWAYTDNLELISNKYPVLLKNLEANIYGAAATNYLKLKVLGKECEYAEDYEYYKKLLKAYKPIICRERLFVSIFYYLYKVPFVLNLVCKVFNKQIQKAIGA